MRVNLVPVDAAGNELAARLNVDWDHAMCTRNGAVLFAPVESLNWRMPRGREPAFIDILAEDGEPLYRIEPQFPYSGRFRTTLCGSVYTIERAYH